MKVRDVRCAAALAALGISASTGAQAGPAAPVDLLKVQQIVGSWGYQPYSGGSQATFVDTGGHARMVVRCNRSARLVTITRTAVAAATPTLTVTTSFGAQSVPARFDSSGNLSADVPAASALLDNMAFSRGRFAVASEGSAPLVVPAWAEISRVVEDCRS